MRWGAGDPRPVGEGTQGRGERLSYRKYLINVALWFFFYIPAAIAIIWALFQL